MGAAQTASDGQTLASLDQRALERIAVIHVYPVKPSVPVGGELELAISGDCTIAWLRFIRVGAVHELMAAYCDQAIVLNAASFRFSVPNDWRPGVYIVACYSGTHDRRPLDRRDGRALFIVRGKPKGNVLYNVPLFTYHAYNIAHDRAEEDTCLYNGAPSVTIARPGGGIGGHLWDEKHVDVYDPLSPRQTFAHWDAKAVAWLEEWLGDRVDYCCDLDLHQDARLLSDYPLVVCFGHHEYWTEQMLAALRQHVASGRHAAFFGGNTCWFTIAYDDASQSISRTHPKGSPAESMFGSSYRFGGGKWHGARPESGYTVHEDRHWAFAGTNLERGNTFGAKRRLVGYECDGIATRAPANYEVLASRDLHDWYVADGTGEINGTGRAVMGIAHHPGILFNAGTVDWPRLLGRREPTVSTITRNIVEHLACA